MDIDRHISCTYMYIYIHSYICVYNIYIYIHSYICVYKEELHLWEIA